MLIARALAEEIIERQLAPDYALPTEARMVEMFGVGRATLREALRLLELEGLIRMKPGRSGGPVVDTPSPDRLVEVLAILLAAEGTSFGEVLDTRAVIQPHLASRAARLATPDDLAQMHAAVAAEEELVDNETQYLLASRRFHRAVAAASHTRPLERLYFAISGVADGQALGVTYGRKVLRSAVRTHREILAAIEAKDEERAYATTAKQLREQTAFMEKNYADLLERRIRLASPIDGRAVGVPMLLDDVDQPAER
jgi:DNA-binding FadR family transcriptional regulator